MALETSAESPAAVRTVSRLLSDWIGRLGGIWVDGQVAEFRRRPGARNLYLTLRDPDVDMSITVVADVSVIGAVEPPLAEGQRIIVFGKPEFWTGRGTLSLRAKEIRAVGLGELLAQLARLRELLTAEGLFAADRKKPLPFLPRRVGLICGRNSAAMHDVLVNARERWPSIQFVVREVAVQGVQAVSGVSEALAELDALPDVDVIVIARGGGSVEDLLPFSNETLVRAVAACSRLVVAHSCAPRGGRAARSRITARYRSAPAKPHRRAERDHFARERDRPSLCSSSHTLPRGHLGTRLRHRHQCGRCHRPNS